MKAGSRHSTPLLVRQGKPDLKLTRVILGKDAGDRGLRENFIQSLVHDHPELIPMVEIEPAFMPLIPVCTELAMSSGSLDNLWLTPFGGIVLGECKLVRNPEARREVVAQALDYARAIAAWRYSDLEAGVRRALKSPSAKLWDFVKGAPDALDEAQFADAVERRLRSGQFMILLIGDGIQEGVEALTEHLQLHAGLHVGLALVELSIWRGDDDNLLIVPRIPMRTVLIERGIVVVDPAGGVRIEPPRTAPANASAGRVAQPISLSEVDFYARIEQRNPDAAAKLRAFVESLAPLNVDTEFLKVSMKLIWRETERRSAVLGTIDFPQVWFTGAPASAARLGRPEAGIRYLESIARILGGNLHRYPGGTYEVHAQNGRAPELSLLLGFVDKG